LLLLLDDGDKSCIGAALCCEEDVLLLTPLAKSRGDDQADKRNTSSHKLDAAEADELAPTIHSHPCEMKENVITAGNKGEETANDAENGQDTTVGIEKALQQVRGEVCDGFHVLLKMFVEFDSQKAVVERFHERSNKSVKRVQDRVKDKGLESAKERERHSRQRPALKRESAAGEEDKNVPARE
jgi:hypothetical protein